MTTTLGAFSATLGAFSATLGAFSATLVFVLARTLIPFNSGQLVVPFDRQFSQVGLAVKNGRCKKELFVKKIIELL